MQPCKTPDEVFEIIKAQAPDVHVVNQSFIPENYALPLGVLTMISDSAGDEKALAKLSRPVSGVTMLGVTDRQGVGKSLFVLYDYSRCPGPVFGYKDEFWNLALHKYMVMMKMIEDDITPGRDA